MVFLKDQCLALCFLLIYINDRPSILKVLSVYLLTDYTNIYLSSHDLFSLQKIMNKELRKVKK